MYNKIKNDMNKEFLYMQKLAGIITESEYAAKLEEASDEEQQKDVASIDKKEFYIGSVNGFDVYELPKGRKDLYDIARELNIIPDLGWVHPTPGVHVGMKENFDEFIEKGPLFIFAKPGSKERYIFSYENIYLSLLPGFAKINKGPFSINSSKFSFIPTCTPGVGCTQPRSGIIFNSRAISYKSLRPFGNSYTSNPFTEPI